MNRNEPSAPVPEPGLLRWRLFAVMLFFGGCAIALIGRTAYLQTAQYDYFTRQAQDEHWERETILAQRGTLRDRNGHPLAMTMSSFRVLVRPNKDLTADQVSRASRELAPLLQLPSDRIADIYRSAGTTPVLLKGQLAYDLGVKIGELGLPSVRLQRESRRVYPEGSLAAAVLGFIGKDNKGLAGVEADFDVELTGRPGQLVFERDTRGEEIPLGYREFTQPQEGADVVLTIDRYVQRIVERELDAAVKRHGASGGAILIVEPRTGAIVAMASRPTYDLTRLDLSDQRAVDLIRNRAIADVYEPGSVFKIFTAAIGLETGVVNPNSSLDCKGVVVKQGWPIRTWNFVAHGRETVTEVLVNSCNVGAVWISDLIGPQRFYQFTSAFGFGRLTGIELGGEAAGQIHQASERNWPPLDVATNSFGQGLSATPLQVVMAVAAVANDGVLMRPQIVRRIEGPDGVRNFRPVAVRRVISVEHSRQLGGMLKAALEGGSRLAKVPGYNLGGKSGTAEKPESGGYTSKTIASFAGYGPIEDPRFAMLVKIDEPQDNPFGSQVAGPIFSTIGRQLMTYYRIPPNE